VRAGARMRETTDKHGQRPCEPRYQHVHLGHGLDERLAWEGERRGILGGWPAGAASAWPVTAGWRGLLTWIMWFPPRSRRLLAGHWGRFGPCS
jgi:hypothetical protein